MISSSPNKNKLRASIGLPPAAQSADVLVFLALNACRYIITAVPPYTHVRLQGKLGAEQEARASMSLSAHAPAFPGVCCVCVLPRNLLDLSALHRVGGFLRRPHLAVATAQQRPPLPPLGATTSLSVDPPSNWGCVAVNALSVASFAARSTSQSGGPTAVSGEQRGPTPETEPFSRRTLWCFGPLRENGAGCASRSSWMPAKISLESVLREQSSRDRSEHRQLVAQRLDFVPILG